MSAAHQLRDTEPRFAGELELGLAVEPALDDCPADCPGQRSPEQCLGCGEPADERWPVAFGCGPDLGLTFEALDEAAARAARAPFWPPLIEGCGPLPEMFRDLLLDLRAEDCCPARDLDDEADAALRLH